MYKFFNFLYNSIRGAKKMEQTYTVIIHEEDGIFWGECQELEGCFAQAKTIEELKKLMIESIYIYFSEELDKDMIEQKIKLDVSYA